MKRIPAIILVVLVLSASAQAVDYSWNTTTTTVTDKWASATSWDVGSGWPDDPTDRAIFANGGNWYTTRDGSGFSITVGEVILNAGKFHQGTGLGYTVKTQDCATAGTNGDFWWRSTTAADYYMGDNPAGKWTWDIAGNFYYVPTTSSGGPPARGLIIMRGDDKAIKWNNATSGVWSVNGTIFLPFDLDIYGQRVWDNGSNRFSISSNANTNTTVTVKTGGSIGANPDGTTAGSWKARRFIFEDGQSSLPALKAPVDFIYACLPTVDNNTPGKLVLTGGVTYPRDVTIGHGYTNATPNNPYFTWKIKGGDVTIGRDLRLRNYGNYIGGEYILDTSDNDTGVSRNLTVLQDLLVAPSTAGIAYNDFYGIKTNSSTVRVGRHLVMGMDTTAYYGWAPRNYSLNDLGNATIYVGGDLTVHRMDPTAKARWSAGTSTVIMDGNGTGTGNQVIRTFGYLDCVALNNLVINSPMSVVLDNGNWGPAPAVKPGGLLLTGNLEIYSRFNDSNLPIAFNGPEHLLKIGPGGSLAGGSLDNIILLTDAVMRLGSDVTMDNLEMQSGSQLFLNGFTLMAEGNTWISDQIDSLVGTPYEQGTIYGTLPIPEPATMLLMGSGALAALGYARRRRLT